MIEDMLPDVFVCMLISCALVLLAGWAFDPAGDDIAGGDRVSSSVHEPGGFDGFAAHGDLAGWDWPAVVSQIGPRDLEREGWWG
jgi:hypothetical protein